MSTKRTVPSTSARIGFVYGSQVKITWSRFTSSPSSTIMIAPSGTCRRAATLAFLSPDDLMRISPSYDVTIRCPSGFVTTIRRSPYSIDARDLRLARRLLGDTSRRSTDVEGAQRELRARLADRLRGNDTDRFAQVDDVHRRQVAAVAHAAETALRLTGEDGADLHHLDARLFDLLRLLFVDQLTGFDEQRATARLIQLVRILDVLGGEVADDTLRQRLDHVLAFLQRGRPRDPGSCRNPLRVIVTSCATSTRRRVR